MYEQSGEIFCTPNARLQSDGVEVRDELDADDPIPVADLRFADFHKPKPVHRRVLLPDASLNVSWEQIKGQE